MLPERSIAVLPFVNLSADPENEFVCDGVTEEVLNALSHLPGLRVAGRTSSFSFKGKSADLRSIGEQLQVRITAQLTDATDGCHLWSERYGREIADVIAVQHDIAGAIAERLRISIAGDSWRGQRSTRSIEAGEAFLKGRTRIHRRAPPEALAMLRQALAVPSRRTSPGRASRTRLLATPPFFTPPSRGPMHPQSRAPLALLVLALSVAGAGISPLTAQQPDAHPTFTVGTAIARRGEKSTGVIAVPAGSDAALDIPVAVVHGARPGPVLAVVAGAHGTEYASILAAERLIQKLDATRVRGTVIVVPLVNIPSFERMTPHLNPVDGKNMNRFYPGNPGGTQTERASAAITRAVVEPTDFLIDMHGGDLDESLRPFSYWTVTGNATQDSISRVLVLAFGLDHVVISRDRPRDPAASRYLENTASTRGKPSFTVEAGYAGVSTPADVDTLVNGVLKTMAQLKMLDRKFTPVQKPIWLAEMLSVTAGATGIFYPEVRRDQRVTKGMRLGHTTDYLGRELEVATSPADGIVLYVRPVPSMGKGETIAAIGVVGRP